MQPFLHDRLQKLGQLLDSSNQALRLHAARDLGINEATAAVLDQAGTAYRGMGSSSGENEMLALKAQFALACDGVHPLSLERVASRRREMQRGVALRVLTASAERLRADYDDAERQLAGARERLLPMVLYSLQKGFIVLDPEGSYSESELNALWESLLDDPESQAAARQVALTVAAADILLLLGDLLASLQ